MKTSQTNSMTSTVEISPMLIIKTNVLDMEFAPAYQLSIGDSKTTSYYASPAGASTFGESTPVSHAFKLNFLLAKVFADRYRLGVGTEFFRYNLGTSNFESKLSTTTTTTTKSKSYPSGFSGGSLFYIHFSVFFM